MSTVANDTAEPPAPLRGVDTMLYCIGAQKGGTTWLHAQLQKHRRVHFARKEFHYWDAVRSPFLELRAVPLGPLEPLARRLAGPSGDRLARLHPKLRRAVLGWRMLLSSPLDHDAYTRFLTLDNPGCRVVGDVTPSYSLLGRRSFADMAALHPNSRFIFIMRDPVDRLWSGVRHRTRAWARDPKGGAQVALRAFEDALADPMNADLRRSDYARTITELEAAVPSHRILYLFYETLFSPEQIERLCVFLNIAPFEASFEERTHEGVSYDVRPAADQMARAREILAPSYDFVAARFGEATPDAWGIAGAATGPRS